MKYTPGPWKVINGWNPDGSYREEKKLLPSVVMVENDKPGRPYRCSIIMNMSHNQEAESIMANAFLVAAAPELLEALEEASNALRSANVVILVNKYDAIIKKAKGG